MRNAHHLPPFMSEMLTKINLVLQMTELLFRSNLEKENCTQTHEKVRDDMYKKCVKSDHVLFQYFPIQ